MPPAKKAKKKPAKKPKLLKVLLQDRGEDAETPWAEDLGAVKGRGTKKGARRVRLVNVPFLHAKPTYGDVIVVEPDDEGMLVWDAGGVPWKKIGTRIEEDGGRYAAIVDYLPGKGLDAHPVFGALRAAAAKLKIITEGCFGPRDKEPGRAYFAVPDKVTPAAMMKALKAAKTKVKLTLVHPLKGS